MGKAALLAVLGHPHTPVMAAALAVMVGHRISISGAAVAVQVDMPGRAAMARSVPGQLAATDKLALGAVVAVVVALSKTTPATAAVVVALVDMAKEGTVMVVPTLLVLVAAGALAAEVLAGAVDGTLPTDMAAVVAVAVAHRVLVGISPPEVGA